MYVVPDFLSRTQIHVLGAANGSVLTVALGAPSYRSRRGWPNPPDNRSYRLMGIRDQGG
jgi:hypothetical protein